jgi:predicted nucleic acid-binding protein
MPGFLPDTSCLVAVVCVWHEHHGRAAQELERRLGQDEPMRIAGPSLIETYAVLTRLPPPHRLSPADTLALLEANFMSADVIALDADSYRTLLRQTPGEGVSGGRVYDSVIAACALKAAVSVLLTFNANHFLPFSTPGLRIVVPQ